MNTIFTACDAKTGQVLYSGTAFNPENMETNETVIYLNEKYPEGWVTDGTHFNLPERPNEYCTFNYETKTWVDYRTVDTQWDDTKRYRNQLLTDSDWTQLPDVAITNKVAWADYRQQLRDITTQPDPFNITWPTSP